MVVRWEWRNWSREIRVMDSEKGNWPIVRDNGDAGMDFIYSLEVEVEVELLTSNNVIAKGVRK